MNTEFLRTFLAISEIRSFVGAAEQLNVTQSTVSSRINQLEASLGVRLFERSKVGVELTPAGQRVHRHAANMVQLWEQCRHVAALPGPFSDSLAIGARYGLWDPLVLEWVTQFRKMNTTIALEAEVGVARGLVNRVLDGALDLAIIYSPPAHPSLKARRLFDEEFVLVTPNASDAEYPPRNYIYIDWGTDFSTRHKLLSPELSDVGLRVNLGALGLQLADRLQSAVYFPERLVASQIANQALFSVKGAPKIKYPVFAVHLHGDNREILAAAIDSLQAVCPSEPNWEASGLNQSRGSQP